MVVDDLQGSAHDSRGPGNGPVVEVPRMEVKFGAFFMDASDELVHHQREDQRAQRVSLLNPLG